MLLASTSAAAPAGVAPHLRPEGAVERALLDELTSRTATVRAFVDALDASDVVVYIRHRIFTSTELEGRIGFLESERRVAGPMRYVVVELACGRSRIDELVTLGHELRHAVEIANAPEVVDARTLSAHYRRIGVRTSGPTEWERFETRAAAEASSEIRRELLERARTTHDRD